MKLNLSHFFMLANEGTSTGTSTDVSDILKNAQTGKPSAAFAGVSDKVSATGNGIYSILLVVAVLVFLIAGGWGFVKGFVFGTQQERQEFKSGLLFKLLMIVGFFALASIITLLANMGANLF